MLSYLLFATCLLFFAPNFVCVADQHHFYADLDPTFHSLNNANLQPLALHPFIAP